MSEPLVHSGATNACTEARKLFFGSTGIARCFCCRMSVVVSLTQQQPMFRDAAAAVLESAPVCSVPSLSFMYFHSSLPVPFEGVCAQLAPIRRGSTAAAPPLGRRWLRCWRCAAAGPRVRSRRVEGFASSPSAAAGRASGAPPRFPT